MPSLYSDPAVQSRLIEFLGGDTLEHATAIYITRADGCRFDQSQFRQPAELTRFLVGDSDIARSFADSSSMLFHLDVEYVNFDSPAEAFFDPMRAFELQEPVVRVIETLLLEWGIRPLHLVTGQGHHFVWRILKTGALAERLEALGPAQELLDECQNRVRWDFRSFIDRSAHSIFASISLVMEYLAHRVKEVASPLTQVPVEITAVHVGPTSSRHRELISIDISAYGDPIHMRTMRMPFTHYVKPWIHGVAAVETNGRRISQIYSLPLHEIDVYQALRIRQSEEEVCDLARRACVRIPLQEPGTAALLDEYLLSSLRAFHCYFYADEHDEKQRWPETYGRTPMEALTPCTRRILEWPNDLLLKPAGIQLVTRSLLASGWHPRHIAGLIRSRFEDPSYEWREDWSEYVAALRADFYTRLFSGLIATGRDQLVDLNCTSTREKGFCCAPMPGVCDLEPVRRSLLAGSHR